MHALTSIIRSFAGSLGRWRLARLKASMEKAHTHYVAAADAAEAAEAAFVSAEGLQAVVAFRIGTAASDREVKARTAYKAAKQAYEAALAASK